MDQGKGIEATDVVSQYNPETERWKMYSYDESLQTGLYGMNTFMDAPLQSGKDGTFVLKTKVKCMKGGRQGQILATIEASAEVEVRYLRKLRETWRTGVNGAIKVY